MMAKKNTAKELIKNSIGIIDELKDIEPHNEERTNPYLVIRAVLPILRIMEMENEKEWKIDGTLWE